MTTPTPQDSVIAAALYRLGDTMPRAPLPGSMDAAYAADWHAIVAHIDQQAAALAASEARVAELATEMAEVREAYTNRTRECYATGDAYDAMRTRAEATEQSLAEAIGLLREAAPFVDSFPDLTRPGGDELRQRIDAMLLKGDPK